MVFLLDIRENMGAYQIQSRTNKLSFFSGNLINYNMRYTENRNNVTEFILLGLTKNPKMQKVIFAVLWVVYFMSTVGNVLTLVTITTSSLLGSPVYFFLAQLSSIDVCYSCVNTPKLIVDSLHEKKTSSFNECMTHIFEEHLFAGADIILMIAMAYDRYMAICKPFELACLLVVSGGWHGQDVFFMQPFRSSSSSDYPFVIELPNVIDQFMCDLSPLLKLACADTHTLGLFVAANSWFICFLIFLLLVGSYS
ncbi:olfactory receptor 4C13-like [Moschus berezovskii]|uniref:olfactory receptor 4C13-like n=1 Tax=Moschus berezovskii TaxID=68408 RepID=UPI002444FEBC|nr:olfactory receptor 4C13-like [Moschus berezovskii]